ncbi:MAG: sigma-54-dependent transcriptional regulator, partial [Vicinamibacterales bacterium]
MSPDPKPTVLVVDDNASFRESMTRALRSGYSVLSAGTVEEALREIQSAPEAVLLDLCLSEDSADPREGLRLLEQLQAQAPGTPVVMITAHGDVEIAVECMRLGATDFLQKRADIREVRARLDRAVVQGRQTRRMRELQRDLDLLEPCRILGESEAMGTIRRLVELIAQDAAVTVLVRGETGTGKELVARTLHAAGRRRSGPFVAEMLSAVPATLVDAELFGHEAGAFTDAKGRRVGCIERAHGGILFLDEIADIDAAIQGKLLRLIEDREFYRLGGTTSVKPDVQIVAATNADLESLVQKGTFRADLLYRLKVCEIVLPPLRERREDIPALIAHFLDIFKSQGKKVHRISPAASDLLQRAELPGNVRQLRNVLESSTFWAQLRGHAQIETIDLPAEVSARSSPPRATAGSPDFSVQYALDHTELWYIDEALRAAAGRKSDAWRQLGYRNREALYRRVRIILRRSPAL